MERVATLVIRARGGDADAYGTLIRRFQDMAVGYAYSFLRDFQAAQDASQEAFLEAYRLLGGLREPAAFPGWLRRIVFKHCDRILRARGRDTLPIDALEGRAVAAPTQADTAEAAEIGLLVRKAIDLLPDSERATTLLFYIGEYSHREIGAFLKVPVGAVKKRLHSARARLRTRLVHLVEQEVRMQRPSRDERFSSSLVELLRAARAGDLETVRRLLERDPRLRSGRDPFGNTALILAVDSGHAEVAELLLASGVEPDVWESAAIGRTPRVAALVGQDAALLDAFSPEGFTPLALAAHFGHLDTVRLLLDLGADLDLVSRHPIGVTALHAALFGRRTAVAELLIRRGADLGARRGGAGQPRSGWTALHYAAGFGFVSLIGPMLERGAAPEARDTEGRTPHEVAEAAGQAEAAALLRERAARGKPGAGRPHSSGGTHGGEQGVAGRTGRGARAGGRRGTSRPDEGHGRR
jgi:RNA polymerase sigma factor (sigma-70 family)